MPALPWTQRQAVDPGRTYLAMASRLPLRRRRSIPGFLRDAMAIRRQLSRARGMVGYALDAELTRKTFWTFSVWEDQASLDAFAASDPHRAITRRLQPLMAQTRFEFFPIPGSDLPMTWDQMKAPVRGQHSPVRTRQGTAPDDGTGAHGRPGERRKRR
jgi:heme-degrading monooxygenase HmoA